MGAEEAEGERVELPSSSLPHLPQLSSFMPMPYASVSTQHSALTPCIANSDG